VKLIYLFHIDPVNYSFRFRFDIDAITTQYGSGFGMPNQYERLASTLYRIPGGWQKQYIFL